MAKDFYIIIKGRKTGIFENWEEVKSYVNKYSDFKYQGFSYKEKEKAIKYMKSYEVDYNEELNKIISKNKSKNKKNENKYNKSHLIEIAVEQMEKLEEEKQLEIVNYIYKLKKES